MFAFIKAMCRLMLSVHTMLELKMTGNCLKGSRPLLVFDKVRFEMCHTKTSAQSLVVVIPKEERAVQRQHFCWIQLHSNVNDIIVLLFEYYLDVFIFGVCQKLDLNVLFFI